MKPDKTTKARVAVIRIIPAARIRRKIGLFLDEELLVCIWTGSFTLLVYIQIFLRVNKPSVKVPGIDKFIMAHS